VNNETITNISIITTSSSVSTIVIFNEPIYLYLGFISAFIGLISALNDLDRLKKLKANFYTFFVAFKGAFIGFFSAPLVMLTLVLFGNQIAEKMGFDIKETNLYLISFYWGFSILFSRLITHSILTFLERKVNQNDDNSDNK